MDSPAVSIWPATVATAALRHQHHHMIKEIADFVLDFLRVRIFGSDDNLRRLFAQLFEDLVNALVKEVIGVGALLRIFLAILDHAHDILKHCLCAAVRRLRRHHVAVKTARVAGVAGSSHLQNPCEQRVVVTVQGNLLYKLIMPGCLPLQPQLLAASAEIRHPSCDQRLLKRLLVHIGKHQHLLCPVVLHDHRNQPVRICLQVAPGKRAFQRLHTDAKLRKASAQTHKIQLRRSARRNARHFVKF